jgi:hypothetical protein
MATGVINVCKRIAMSQNNHKLKKEIILVKEYNEVFIIMFHTYAHLDLRV